MVDVDKLRRLDDCYEWHHNEDSDGYEIIVNGKAYPYQMTLSPNYPDALCARVRIDRKWYYFNPDDGWC